MVNGHKHHLMSTLTIPSSEQVATYSPFGSIDILFTDTMCDANDHGTFICVLI